MPKATFCLRFLAVARISGRCFTARAFELVKEINVATANLLDLVRALTRDIDRARGILADMVGTSRDPARDGTVAQNGTAPRSRIPGEWCADLMWLRGPATGPEYESFNLRNGRVRLA